MFLRCKKRVKDGKEHLYWSIVENRRVSGGRVLQRHVLYLGELNARQEASWQKSIELFAQDGEKNPRQALLFPEEHLPAHVGESSVPVVGVRLSQMRLHKPRQWGACWLGCQLWEQLGLDEFWGERMRQGRQGALDRKKLRQTRRREGRYLLRTNLDCQDPARFWEYYLQLTQIEQAFKELKSDLSIRPIYHQRQDRIEAHIFVCFMAYCLQVTLKARLKTKASGLTPRSVLEKFASVQMLDVHLPTTDGREIVLTRYTQPEKELLLLLQELGLSLPEQAPPPKSTPSISKITPLCSADLLTQRLPVAREKVRKVVQSAKKG
jgi:hypothetical protein